MQGHRHVLLLKSEVISSLRSSLSTPSLSQCIEELVFNSLDAKATCIAVRVDLENYRVQVVDNGCGISSSDLTLVGQRYATSKCYRLEDLNTLAFFGFRGEFLASLSNISSVLEVISRPKGAKTTFSKLFQKGEVYEIGEATENRPANGTTVTAYNVFYNLPVRQKKINSALDLERIRKRLEAFAIIHHDVSFSLRDDLSGTKIFQTHTTLSPKSAFGFLFGHPKANNLKEIANSYRNFSVRGYVATEGHANKNQQYIYVNKQLVLKTKLHKLVNHVLNRSLLLKPQRYGKNPDSPIQLDSSSHCQQSSPPRGQGENAIFILDIKCLRSEYDIQYDNHHTFLEFQDWKGVSTCLEQALQQFLAKENLCLISGEEKDTKEKEEVVVDEDSDEESLSENEEVLSQPCPAQLAKLQKYGYNISTRNCTNNLQSRVVTRAHIRNKAKACNIDKKELKAGNNWQNLVKSVDFKDLEEASKRLTPNSKSDDMLSTDIPPQSNDESFTCILGENQPHEDIVKSDLPENDEETSQAEAKKGRGSRILIPEVSSCSKSTVLEDSESIPLMMPSCASTLSTGLNNYSKMSENSCIDNLTVGQEVSLTSQNVFAALHHNKTLKKGGPLVSAASSRSIDTTATQEKVMSTTARGEKSYDFRQVGSRNTESKGGLSEDNFSHEADKTDVNEEDISMVTCDTDSSKRHNPDHVNKRVRFKSAGNSSADSNVHKVSSVLEKHEGEKTNDSLSDDGRKFQRQELSQDQNTADVETVETGVTYTSSLKRFKNGLKSRPVNVASNLAAKISKALNKAKAQNAIFCPNSYNSYTASHLSQMRSHFFPVTENELPEEIRQAPAIRLSQKLAWLKKCKPSEKENFAKMNEDNSLSLDQPLVKDLYSERKIVIQRRGTSEYKEMIGHERQPKLGEISNQCISHNCAPSTTCLEQIEIGETLLDRRNVPCRSQNSSVSDFTTVCSKCGPCQRNSGQDIKVPIFSHQPEVNLGHFPPDSLLANEVRLPNCCKVHRNFQEGKFENTYSRNECILHCKLCSHVFMSTESFIQPARDVLPRKNPQSIDVVQDSLATCSRTNFVDKKEITVGKFVGGLDEDVLQEHQNNNDRVPSVDSEEIMLENSYNGQQSRSKVVTFKNNGYSASETVSSSDIKAISEEKHKKILSMLDNPSLFSPEKEEQVVSDICVPFISDGGDQVPFSSYKEYDLEEMPSTQPFHVQNSPAMNVQDFERQHKTFGLFMSQTEDGDAEGKSSESLKTGHLSPSNPSELQVGGNERSLNKLTTVLPAAQEEELTHCTKGKLPSKEKSQMSMNWDLFDENNADQLPVSDNSLKLLAPKLRDDAENYSVSHGRDNLLQTDRAIPDVIEHAGPLNDGRVLVWSQERVNDPCANTAKENDFDRPKASTRVILRKDHTIVVEKTGSEYPLQNKMFNSEFQISDEHLVRNGEKTFDSGWQKECDQPSQQSPTREKVAQLYGTDVPSTTDEGLGCGEKTGFMKKVSNHVPWELYWFLPKTAKPFFPRPVQDRHPVPDKTAILQSGHLLEEFLNEENESASPQSKWKHGIPHIEKEDSRSFDELFDNWQNPVFKTIGPDLSDSNATRLISATVKVHNSLHPYQFTKEIFETIEVIGQLDKKFIVCLVSTSMQRKTETKPHLLVVIDQHAAHERVRLEQLTQEAYVDFDDNSDSEETSSSYLQDTAVPPLRSCQVIPPIPINITDEECRLAQAFPQKLRRFGVTLSISKIGKEYRAEVTELPACMVEREANMVKKARQTVAADLAEALVQECIQQLQDGAGSCVSLPRTITKILNSQACRGAIKFGDPLTRDDILSLLSQLSKCNLPFQCAHGRPSIIPLLDFNHLTAKLNSQDTHSHHPKVNLKRLGQKQNENCGR